jgi:DNA-binding CsgD family transcriptional regulator
LETRFPDLQTSLRELIRRWSESAPFSEELIGPVAGLILRVVPLSGPLGHFYAIFFEREARREDLSQAVARFSFTPREVEVLDRILNGMNAAEIAEDLCIAEVTVFDHFKHISHKTKARNRADMLAKIFNWQSDLKITERGKRRAERRSISKYPY